MDHPVSNLIEADGFLIASATDVGRKRTGNEDSHALWVGEDAALRAERGMLLVVCDGMGGASAGEVASQLAVTTVVDRVRAGAGGGPAETLRDAIEQANDTVHRQAAAHLDQRGMGTTCTAVILRGTEVWVGHVGDSRAYLVRGGTAQQLTKDHSLVAELVEKGHLTEEEAKHDPRRNVVTRSMGALDEVQVDAELAFDGTRAGDVIVVCSDGLHGLVTSAEIARIAGELPPAEACAGLIDLANERGGPDNITAIVVRRSGELTGDAPTTAGSSKRAQGERDEPGPKSPANVGVLGVVAAVMLVLVAVVGVVLFGQLKRPGSVRTGSDPVVTPGPSAPAAGAEQPGAAAMSKPTTAKPGAEPGAEPGTEPAGPNAGAPATIAIPPVAKSPPSGSAATKPSPAVVAPSAGAPGATSAARPGTVRLMTRPFQPSTFSIDGEVYAQDVGFLTQALPAGDHVVRVEGAAGGVVDVPVHVVSGGRYSLVAELPVEGPLGNIEITLIGASRAQVLVDGAQYPEPAPCVVRGLAPGPHAIRVMRPKSAQPQGPAEVQVTAGGTVRAEYRFGANR